MKKFITIFNMTVTLGSVFMQSCTQRDEETVSGDYQSGNTQTTLWMRKDSAKPPIQVPTDPPVRDGDNWRVAPE